eukprot:Nitzschia sp. Nitz4//scaffold92_size79448//25933//35941//NITZ4_005388-RA/size79448-processed-gene-0.72-mRNA-1//-1//CDS//3329560177//3374//frame0
MSHSDGDRRDNSSQDRAPGAYRSGNDTITTPDSRSLGEPWTILTTQKSLQLQLLLDNVGLAKLVAATQTWRAIEIVRYVERATYGGRPSILARSAAPAGRRSFLNEDLNFENYEMWGDQDDDAMEMGEDEQVAFVALGLEAGIPSVRASRVNASNTLDPDELLRLARDTPSMYQPTWMNHSDLQRHMSTGNGIDVGSGDYQRVGHLPLGMGEGRALRTLEPFPRISPFSSLNLASGSLGSSPFSDPRSKRAMGFKVAFQGPPPAAEPGSNLGGGFLVGVTTSSFSAFGEKDALLQSSNFWGIDDIGHKHEGSRLPSPLSASEVPRNACGALFGSMEVVTCVMETETRTLTFWRGDICLGTIVSSLPKGSPVYPVCVPFKAGSTVAITGLEDDPIPFPLTKVQAARLWYRSGMKLSHLDELVQSKSTPEITFDDFLQVLNDVISREQDWFEATATCRNEATPTFHVGDWVQLAEGYNRYGDATNGPLKGDDRGVVVEIESPSADGSSSVRVLHNNRRWYYQSHALVNEASGLISSPGVWFIKRVLRAHGFDPYTLESLAGQSLSTGSWRLGDLVAPKKLASNDSPVSFENTGRIVSDHLAPKDKPRSSGQDHGTVSVEYVSKEFAEACRVENKEGIQSKTISISRFCFASPPLGDRIGEKESIGMLTGGGISDKVLTDLENIGNLDPGAISAITKECKKNTTTLAYLFEQGLAEEVEKACNRLFEKRSGKEIESLAPAISALGSLALVAFQKAFPENQGAQPASEQSSTEEKLASAAMYAAEDYYVQRNIEQHTTRGQSAHRTHEIQRARVAQVLEQRRNMLLSLVSQSRTNPSSLTAFLQGSFGQLNNETSLSEMTRLGTGGDGSQGTENEESKKPFEAAVCTLLTSMLMCRQTEQLSDKQATAAFHSNAIKPAVINALLTSSLPWLKAALEYPDTKSFSRVSSTREPVVPLLRDCTGVPILQLALALGSSSEVIQYLIQSGCSVGDEEICRAAYSGQVEALAVLLRYSVYTEGTVELELCSESVRTVLAEAVLRQRSQLVAIRNGTSELVSTTLRKFYALGLQFRRGSVPDLACSAVTQVLVGNVVLRALRKPRVREGSDLDGESGDDDYGDRGSPEDPEIVWSSPKVGLFEVVPGELVEKSFATGTEHITDLLLLIEDFLCHREVNDICIGLALLSFLLKKFPAIQSSSEIDRYGFVELVASQDALAANMLSQAASSILNRDSSSGASKGIVKCKKGHAAKIHVTRHSSFRCDLCGKGVDRGRTMFGCRECDWDACETCTDKGEGGVAKWEYVRETAQTCMSIFAQSQLVPNEMQVVTSNNSLIFPDNSVEVNNLSCRILQRDISCIEDLSKMLSRHGALTMHQFLGVLLPALHFALVEKELKNAEFDNAVLSTRRRSKRPRVLSSPREENRSQSSTERVAFARELSRILVTGNSESLEAEVDSSRAGERRQDDGTGSATMINSDFLRRLHQILALYESVPVVSSFKRKSRSNGTPSNDDLHALTKPITLKLVPVSGQKLQAPATKAQELQVKADPIVSIGDLAMHVLRSQCTFEQRYVTFCHRLANEGTIILERPLYRGDQNSCIWRVGKVMSYNSTEGYHVVRYASNIRGHEGTDLGLDADFRSKLDSFEFNNESKVLLLSREVYVLDRSLPRDYRERSSSFGLDDNLDPHIGVGDHLDRSPRIHPAIGLRVDSIVSSAKWRPATIIGSSDFPSSVLSNSEEYTLVFDDGNVHTNVAASQVQGLGTYSDDSLLSDRFSSGRHRGSVRSQAARSFHLLSARRQAAERRGSSSHSNKYHGVLRRQWSALSLRESMCPVDLQNGPGEVAANMILIGSTKLRLTGDVTHFEKIPSLHVKFGVQISQGLPVDVSSSPDLTVAALLTAAQQGDEPLYGADGVFQLFFSVDCDIESSLKDKIPSAFELPSLNKLGDYGFNSFFDAETEQVSSRKRPPWSSMGSMREILEGAMSDNDDEVSPNSLCDGLDEICVQCMEILSILADLSKGENGNLATRNALTFENQDLSKRLSEQLESPLVVIGGSLPSWCFDAPAFAPCVFRYNARRMLLQRAAFGVSRGVLNLQESKVEVSRLRQRMATLRARAVELVGEAFSGGAEDPTALQLQADELYGMEEALAARVRAAFRAEKWEEHALEAVKVAVSREMLLSDAITAMDQYATTSFLNRRRLEVRFTGESGFDAASGDEAGVTRGFYADVAEALLSCDVVAGVGASVICPDGVSGSSAPMNRDPKRKGLSCQLPLWIPDVDAGGLVIIPTPRSDPKSALGVFPRPLSASNPLYPEVLDTFRFMGRLFAAALRDGYMFPVPLSASFLKLVQLRSQEHFWESSALCWGEDNGRYLAKSFGGNQKKESTLLLKSSDLPRAGFIGGEIAAVESFIVQALDQVDGALPKYSPAERDLRYREIATDKDFARVALGRNFDCSFEDYFEDRTFVDPLDPAQGLGAVPLCPNGHNRPVTIQNIREWVTLAKRFVLHDGVMAQAMAFRSGVEDFFSAEYLRLFTAGELQRDVCGSGDDVDNWDEASVRALFKIDGSKGATEALVAVASMGGEGGTTSRRFGPTSPTIQYVSSIKVNMMGLRVCNPRSSIALGAAAALTTSRWYVERSVAPATMKEAGRLVHKSVPKLIQSRGMASSAATAKPSPSFVQWYESHLEKNPIATKMVTGSILWGLGDFVAQVFPYLSVAKEEGKEKAFVYDFPRTGRAVTFGFLLHAPTSHVHFNLLEWMTVRAGFTGLQIPVFKTIMEQFVYWSWISNSMYHGAMGAMQGMTPQQIYDRIADVLWDTQKAQWAFWIPVQLLNFNFVPVRHQLNVVLVTSIVWTALLSIWYPPVEEEPKKEE